MLSGCLVDDPPPYTQPNKTPPRLDYHHALPLLNQVIVRKTGDTLEFDVPVASEDAGEDLNSLLLLDYAGGADPSKVVPGTGQTITASTLDDTSRHIKTKWTVSFFGEKGCHRLTLRVTHKSNVNINNFPDVFNDTDLAEAYWWANLDADPTSGNMLVDCPQASEAPPSQ